MRTRDITAAIAAATVGIMFLLARDAPGQTADLRVLASNGVRAVMEELLPQCERAVGRRLAIRFNSSASLKQSIAAGEGFDVAIVTAELLDELIKGGTIASGTRAAVARSGIGLGIHKGMPKPDITTPEALKQTLLNAKSITYAQDGASRPHIVTMLDRFGITEAVKSKTVLEQGSTRSAARVADGDVELIVTLISEIVPVGGIDFVGPLPAPFQHYVSFATGVATKSTSTEAARALITFLAGPGIAPILKAKGLEQ